MSHQPNDATLEQPGHVIVRLVPGLLLELDPGLVRLPLVTGLHPLKFASALRMAAGAIPSADGTRFLLTPRGRRG